jgi:outer membrane protein assembly factor BamA
LRLHQRKRFVNSGSFHSPGKTEYSISSFLSLSIFLLLLLPYDCFSQKTITLRIHLSDTAETESFSKIKKQLLSQESFRDTILAQKELQTALLKLHNSGYLAASFDSVYTDSLTLHAALHLGKTYKLAYLGKGNVENPYLSGTALRKNYRSERPYSHKEIVSIQKRILRNCENEGYPFASLYLDSIVFEQEKISAQINLNKNKAVFIDSVTIRGDAAIAPVFIYNYLGVKPGDLYNESQISKISFRLKELAFVREVRENRVIFTDKYTKVELFLENKKASQFDGILGLLPDENKAGKYKVTGEAHIKLQNSLRRGEIIELNWKQLPNSSQDLKIRALYPFLFNTPFGLDGYLSIFRKDSTYIDVIKSLGVQYSFTGNNYIKAFVKDKQSDLQSSKGLENATVLPAYADIKVLSYGLTFHFENLDYRLNPRRGISFETTGSIGNRDIKKNQDINPVLYDSILLRSTSYQGELIIDKYFSLSGRHVLNLGGIGGYIYNPEIFSNELFRIGGLRSLRGFDEESIFASTYGIAKLEYRYLLEQNSFLFAFVNGAWYENQSRHTLLSDTPVGFGAGINFETRLGVMSLSYALGKQFSNPILLRNGKIHFGIVNYF